MNFLRHQFKTNMESEAYQQLLALQPMHKELPEHLHKDRQMGRLVKFLPCVGIREDEIAQGRPVQLSCTSKEPRILQL